MDEIQKRAFQLILLLGIVSLLGDIIYEGGRSVHGQYLKLLGVGAAKVGFIVGFGEFLGYFLRLISGFFADKTKSYWFLTILGYALLLSVPLISLTGVWQIVAFLIILERIGKGIRTPARDTIASFAAKKIGTGFGFGIAEFLDQVGALIGPLIFTFLFFRATLDQNLLGVYQRGYSFLWIPFALLMITLFYAYFKFKKSEELEKKIETKKEEKSFQANFWLYVLFVFLTTFGLLNFALIGFHLKNFNILSDAKIPFLYTLAMAIDAVIALIIGKLYDRLKMKLRNLYVLLLIPLFSAFIPFLIFSNKLILIFFGIVFFGLVLGIQETILKAVVADITPIERRSSAYGIFNFSFGLAFFGGSTVAGFLYDYSLSTLIITLATLELSSILIFFLMKKR